ncbi:MAG: HEAT repeat domain-containing protein [Thermodesulfovibrionales bacterium]|nr:HEAT repeat domain-containing protein [Thermodesulfovibrionales bacterium]MDP3112656.1 HEAT repeat domain-containing protein [Thermodesulfovibrionales bacterium]
MKEKIKKLLAEKRYDELIALSSSGKNVFRMLISLTYDKKNLISWRAIEAVGLVSKEIAKTRPELVRNTVGRLLWMIRDESGGIGWSSPEMLGEIVRNNPEQFSDIAPIIVSFLDEDMLAAGVLSAIGRIGQANSGLVKHAMPAILPYLHSPDPVLRGLAVYAIGEIGSAGDIGELEKLQDDISLIVIYEKGELREKTVGELAGSSIEKLRGILEK